MTKRTLKNKAPPKELLQALFDHQRWLNSNGRFGARLVLDHDDYEFEDCDLDGIDLSYAILKGVWFVRGTARGVKYFGAELSYVFYEACDIADSDFREAKLEYVTFATNHKDARLAGSHQVELSYDVKEGKRKYAMWERYREQMRASAHERDIDFSP